MQVEYSEKGPMKDAGIEQHVALLNWSDETKLMSVSVYKIGFTLDENMDGLLVRPDGRI
jgi:hypothetical protein